MADWFGKDGPVFRYWNSVWTGGPLWAAFAVVAVYWLHTTPLPGRAIGVLAVVAGVISVRDVKVLGKITWVILLVAFLFAEFRAIGKDRQEAQRAADQDLQEQREHFQRVLDRENQDFQVTASRLALAYQQSQTQFSETMKQFSHSNSEEGRRFGVLAAKSQELFRHEEQLSEATSGVLVPGTSPTPQNRCSKSSPSAFAVFYGDNTSLVQQFPHTVMRSSDGPLITIDKRTDGNIALILDVRDTSGKIVARLDRDGYLIGSRLAIKRPDKSSLIVFDEYGDKALEVHYLNPLALTINGYLNYGGALHSIQPKNLHESCSAGSGTDVEIRTKP